MNQTRTQKSDAEAGADAPPSYTILKFIVIFLGVLLVGGFMFLVGTIAYRIANSGDEPVVEGAAAKETRAVAELLGEIEVLLPAGATVTGHSLEGDRLSIAIATADGPKILIVDLKSGKTISTVSLKSK